MCGIAGYSLDAPVESGQTLCAMVSSIRHRGPDDEGYVFFHRHSQAGQTFSSPRSPEDVQWRWPPLGSALDAGQHHVALAQVRYSIIDLSPGGHQPMWSTCGSACLTFNGEIYNYAELREELRQAGHAFQTRSDSEVLLAAYLHWGEAAFARFNGFFAMALWDVRRQRILLARDRLGKAHLYLTRPAPGSVYWASEIKALIAGGGVERTAIDPAAVADFALRGWRDRGGTFWRGVEDFPPGHYAWIGHAGLEPPQPYWSLPTVRHGTADLTRDEAARGLRDLLCNALEIRLRADVPVAFELSGGMDSSSLVGLTAGVLDKKLTTCTVEFAESHANEEYFARAVATRYPQQIDYHVIKPEADDFWSTADRFVWQQEEPFHAPNLQTNQHLRRLLKQAGAHVVISGAAGDEMLAGYAGDYLGPYLRHLLGQHRYPAFFRELAANNEVPSHLALARLLIDPFLADEQRMRLIQWRSGESALLSRVLAPQLFGLPARRPSSREESSFHGRTLANMTYRRMNYWLRSGAKADYGIPIETRVPFLDYRVVDYCCTLPPEYLIHDGWHKHVLRLAVQDILPAEVVWRRQKMGFPFPFREWLQASRPLARRNAETLDCPWIDSTAFIQEYDALLRTAPVTLWRLLSLILWWRRVIEDRPLITS